MMSPAGLSDTADPQRSPPGLPDTTEPWRSPRGLSDTTEPWRSSRGLSDTTEPRRSSRGLSDTTEPPRSSPGLSNTIELPSGVSATTINLPLRLRSGVDNPPTVNVITSEGQFDINGAANSQNFMAQNQPSTSGQETENEKILLPVRQQSREEEQYHSVVKRIPEEGSDTEQQNCLSEEARQKMKTLHDNMFKPQCRPEDEVVIPDYVLQNVADYVLCEDQEKEQSGLDDINVLSDSDTQRQLYEALKLDEDDEEQKKAQSGVDVNALLTQAQNTNGSLDTHNESEEEGTQMTEQSTPNAEVPATHENANALLTQQHNNGNQETHNTPEEDLTARQQNTYQ